MALRIIAHCYSYLRNITPSHIEEEMSNLWYYAIWLILRIWSIFSQAPQQAHRPVSGCHEPTAAYQGSSRGASRRRRLSLVTQVQPHKTRFDAYHYSSLLIITQFITHHYSSLLKQHYSSLRTITLPQLGQNFIALSDATKLCILSHYTWKSRGGLTPPSIFVRNDE